MSQGSYRVGITRDSLTPDGASPLFGAGPLAILDRAGLAWEFMPAVGRWISPADSARYDAIVSLGAGLSPDSVAGGPVRLRHLARFGAGFDNIDLDVCRLAGLILTNEPQAVCRPVAVVILTFILALSQKLMLKQRLARAGAWGERTRHMGEGLKGKIVGSIGFGHIAKESFALLRPLGVRLRAYSPNASAEEASRLGVELVDFPTLMSESDFVCVNCPLKPETRRMIGDEALALMKRSAYLVNTARGPIVDEAALIAALQAGRIAGAALDVLEQEPTPTDNPLLAMENVIVTPHALCWTDECFREMAEGAFTAVVDVASGRRPAHLVNPAVLGHPRLAGLFAV